MWTRQYRQRKTGRLIVPAISAVVLFYFGFHAFEGEYGFYAKYEVETEIARHTAKLAVLKRQRADLEQRVQLLHDGTFDKDMLDEQIRKALNLAGPDEVIIIRQSGGSGD